MTEFPGVEFPLCSSTEQAAGQPRQYLQSRVNSASVGSFSAATVSSDRELLRFRRNVKGRYVNYHTPCLPLSLPNTRTPYDPVRSPVATNLVSQVTYLQWNYKNVYVPPHLLYQLLSEASSLEKQNEEYDPLLGSAVASLNYHRHTCLFYASGPLLATLTCGVVLSSQNSLSLTECKGYQLQGRILEIQVSRSQGEVFVCARTCYHVTFFQGPTEEEVSSAVSNSSQRGETAPSLMTLLATFQTDCCVASVTVSPYIAGEGVVVTETGGIYMWNQGEQLQVLRKPLTTPSPSGPTHFWRCCYGNHPRSVVLAEHSGVSLCDLRSGQLNLSHLLTCPSEWLPHKSLVSAVSVSPSHPHHLHISTSHSLLLLDLRQPRWPLLDQSHDLGHTPQMLAVAPCPSPSSSEELVMATDSVTGENLVLSVATPTGSPPFISCATHTVARYRELEGMWQGKSALSLIGHRLRLPVGGASLFSLMDSSTPAGKNMETYAAVSMSVWGDLFYQLWSYSDAPPIATPTSSHDDTWLQEALHQEQELQVMREEWHDAAAPVNFNPLLEYLNSDLCTVLCPSCLAWSSHPSLPPPLPSSTPSQATPTPSRTPPTNQRCSFCHERLVPLRTRKLEQRLVSEGLIQETVATTDVTVATGRGLEQLRTHCMFNEPGADSCHDDHMFWEGWVEEGVGEKVSPRSPETTPSRSQQQESEVDHKPLSQTTPSSSSSQRSRSWNRGMGF